jgi:hypothetical protein
LLRKYCELGAELDTSLLQRALSWRWEVLVWAVRKKLPSVLTAVPDLLTQLSTIDLPLMMIDELRSMLLKYQKERLLVTKRSH